MRQLIFSLAAGFALATTLLTGCGGGGGGGTTPPAGSNAGISSASTQVETALSFSLDGLDAGVYGLPVGSGLIAPTAFESPQVASAVHAAAVCTTGSSTATTAGSNQTNLVYTNCVNNGSTLNGTITIAGPTNFVANGVWTTTFAGFSVSGEGSDGKVVKFNYSGTQIIKDVTWNVATKESTAAKVTMNVDINVDNGSSTIKFTNYLIDFSYNTTNMETSIAMAGKFAFDLKLADFGVPATPGLPATINVEFDVTTPTVLKFTETTDSGIYKLTSSLYTMEIDYTNDVAKFTAGGVTQTFPIAK